MQLDISLYKFKLNFLFLSNSEKWGKTLDSPKKHQGCKLEKMCQAGYGHITPIIKQSQPNILFNHKNIWI